MCSFSAKVHKTDKANNLEKSLYEWMAYQTTDLHGIVCPSIQLYDCGLFGVMVCYRRDLQNHPGQVMYAETSF